jgi:hypothetical protein
MFYLQMFILSCKRRYLQPQTGYAWQLSQHKIACDIITDLNLYDKHFIGKL